MKKKKKVVYDKTKLRITVSAIDSAQAEDTAIRLMRALGVECAEVKGPVPLKKIRKGKFKQQKQDDKILPPTQYDNITIHRRLVIFHKPSSEVVDILDHFLVPRNVTLNFAYT